VVFVLKPLCKDKLCIASQIFRLRSWLVYYKLRYDTELCAYSRSTVACRIVRPLFRASITSVNAVTTTKFQTMLQPSKTKLLDYNVI